MRLGSLIDVGISLPQRSSEPVTPDEIVTIARRAEAAGFKDLWVSETTLDRSFCLDSSLVLATAAAVTTRIRLGVSVIVLPVRHPAHVAHQLASLDHLSGGRATLGVGIGRNQHYEQFRVAIDRRVRRFIEGIELIRALWTEEQVDYVGKIYRLESAAMRPKPVQDPLPIWLGGNHPDAVRRAAVIGDGWMGAGSLPATDYRPRVTSLHEALEEAGRDPATFAISKRLYVAIDDDSVSARADLHHWFANVYGAPDRLEDAGVYGTAEQVADQLSSFVDDGATHLLLHPVARHEEQLEALTELAFGTVGRREDDAS